MSRRRRRTCLLSRSGQTASALRSTGCARPPVYRAPVRWRQNQYRRQIWQGGLRVGRCRPTHSADRPFPPAAAAAFSPPLFSTCTSTSADKGAGSGLTTASLAGSRAHVILTTASLAGCTCAGGVRHLRCAERAAHWHPVVHFGDDADLRAVALCSSLD